MWDTADRPGDRGLRRGAGRHASAGRCWPSSVSTPLPASTRPMPRRPCAAVPGVADVHDLHLWTLTSGMNVATAHLVCRDDADPTQVLTEAASVLRERFSIEHATIQVEPSSARACVETSW